MMPLIDQIRAGKYLYLHSLRDEDDGSLSVVLHEAIVGSTPDESVLSAETDPNLRGILVDSRAIIHAPGCRVFELAWDHYVAYSVTNESFALPEPASSSSVGRLFVEFSSSAYLEYIRKITFADDDFPGPLKHWGIYCLNHIVNIVSVQPPVIAARK